MDQYTFIHNGKTYSAEITAEKYSKLSKQALDHIEQSLASMDQTDATLYLFLLSTFLDGSLDKFTKGCVFNDN